MQWGTIDIRVILGRSESVCIVGINWELLVKGIPKGRGFLGVGENQRKRVRFKGRGKIQRKGGRYFLLEVGMGLIYTKT